MLANILICHELNITKSHTRISEMMNQFELQSDYIIVKVGRIKHTLIIEHIY